VTGPLKAGQRWSAGRRRDVVLRMLRGESIQALSRELGVELYRLERWREQALKGLEASLKDHHDDPPGAGTGRGEAAHRRAVDGERVAARAVPGDGASRPFGSSEVAAMSVATSAATGRQYGVKRVCAAWELPRSSYYSWRDAEAGGVKPRGWSTRAPRPIEHRRRRRHATFSDSPWSLDALI
jgi:transposase